MSLSIVFAKIHTINKVDEKIYYLAHLFISACFPDFAYFFWQNKHNHN